LLKGSELLISGGGSLLQNVTSTRSLLYYLGVLWLAKRFGKKSMVYAQGIGPVTGGAARLLTRSILNKVDLITVRDEASKAYLSDLGVNKPDVQITSDPAFVMEPAPAEEVDEILRNSGVPCGTPLIGISVREWRGRATWLPVLAKGIETAASRIGAAVVFLPMQKEQDMGVCIQVASGMSVPTAVITGQPSANQILSVVGRMTLLVGMRLHGLIFAASEAIPFAGISYDPKVDAFVRRVLYEEPIKLDGITSAHVEERIIDIWERRLEMSEMLKKRTEGLRAAAFSNADMACSLIGV
jgi:polysaccharide pyruvyl transferase CsaB